MHLQLSSDSKTLVEVSDNFIGSGHKRLIDVQKERVVLDQFELLTQILNDCLKLLCRRDFELFLDQLRCSTSRSELHNDYVQMER